MAERSAFNRENEPVLVMKVKRFQSRRIPDSIFLKHDIDLCIFFFIAGILLFVRKSKIFIEDL